MPKKFNEYEKEWIRRKLLEQGRLQFEAFGLKKTSVGDLTHSAGIAQGSFYLFFGSKEELFYHILLEEENRIRQSLLSVHLNAEPVTKHSIRHFLFEAFRLMSESPIMKHMLLEGQFELLVRKLPPELLKQNFTEDRDALLPVIRRWQDAGLLRQVRPELIVSLMRALIMLSLHRVEIGEQHYTETIELLLTLIAEGIVNYRI